MFGSGLRYICNYGYNTDSDNSDNSEQENTTNKPRLPTPDLSKVLSVSSENHIDDPQLHGGRIRSFPHIRGNWPTFVYIKYPDESILYTLMNNLQAAILSINESCQKCDDFHISLSKTVVLKYHIITPFTQSLQTALTGTESFDLNFDSVQIFCNEENTRTFVALKVDYFSTKYLLKISEKVDTVLQDFNLPTFYTESSFHMSLLWVNGNKKKQLLNILGNLNSTLNREIGSALKTFSIKKVNCKTGNKHFEYFLD